MSDNFKAFLQNAPGFGILAIIVAALATQFNGKPSSGNNSPPHAPVSAEEKAKSAAAQAEAKNYPATHLEFLKEHGILTPIDALIVAVPDPRETQYGSWFDHAVEAVCRAMGEADFTLERFWYPESWRSRKEGPFKQGDAKDHPGVIVFRSAKNPSERRVVLLVGDNPVSGLHAKALRAAFDFCGDSRTAKSPNQLRVIGPYFSGGQPSLLTGAAEWQRSLLWRIAMWRCGARQFSFYSGSALGLSPIHDLKKEPGMEWLAHIAIEQKFFQIPADSQRKAMMDFLKPLSADKLDPRRVALLLESNSGFGSNIKMKNSDQFDYWRFRYPMHISMLSGRQSQELHEIDVRLGIRDDGLGTIDAQRHAQDLLPSMDEARTAELNRGILTDFWYTIRREQIRYMGVISSDPRDVIFLVGELRRECPGVQPFVFGSDLHFLNRDYLQFMRGTLVVSTYPLNPTLQQWMKPDASSVDPRRIAFASFTSEGIYNATLAMLAKFEDGGKARQLYDMLLDYRPAWIGRGKNSKLRPSIWISVIDENGHFAPLENSVAFDDPDVFADADKVHGPKSLTPRPPTSPPPVSPPQAGRLRFMMLGVIAAGVATFFIWWRTRRPIPVHDYPRTLRRYYQYVMAVELVFVGFPFGLYYLKAWSCYGLTDQWGVEHSESVPLIDILLVLVASVICLAPLTYLLLHAPVLWLARKVRPSMGKNCPENLKERLRKSSLITIIDREIAKPELETEPEALQATPDPQQPSLPYPDPQVAFIVLFLFVSIAVSVLIFLIACESVARNLESALFLERAAALLSGYSVIFVTAATAFGIVAYGGFGLYALSRQFGRYCASPYPANAPAPTADSNPVRKAFGDLADVHAKIENFSCGPFSLRYAWKYHQNFISAVVLILTLLFVAVIPQMRVTFEGRQWDYFFAGALLLIFILLGFSFIRVYTLLKGVEKLLAILANIPMVSAYDRLPEKLHALAGRWLMHSQWKSADLGILHNLIQQIRAKREGARKAAPWFAEKPQENVVDKKIAAIDDYVITASGDEHTSKKLKIYTDLSRAMVEELFDGWRAKNIVLAFGSTDAERAELKSEDDWKPLAEQFIALMTILFLAPLLNRLRLLCYMLATAGATLMAAITSYDFQPERLILYTGAGITFSVALFLLWVIYRVNTNEMIRRIDAGKPGSVLFDSDFLRGFITVIVPLVGLTVTLFNGRLRALFEPLLLLTH